MSTEVAQAKHRLREELRAAVRGLSPEQRATASSAIREHLRRHPVWHKAGTVLLFSALPDEPDLFPLLEELLAQGRVACLPRYDEASHTYQPVRIRKEREDLVPGRFGILEPASFAPQLALNRLDLVLVPGLGFSESGIRLGRGRGFFDRLLARTAACKCGIAFDCQVGRAIPSEPHDIQMNCIVTPTQWMTCPGPRAA